jgi:hypothetical protein
MAKTGTGHLQHAQWAVDGPCCSLLTHQTPNWPGVCVYVQCTTQNEPLAGVVFFLGMEDAGAASASKSKNVIS